MNEQFGIEVKFGLLSAIMDIHLFIVLESKVKLKMAIHWEIYQGDI